MNINSSPAAVVSHMASQHPAVAPDGCRGARTQASSPKGGCACGKAAALVWASRGASLGLLPTGEVSGLEAALAGEPWHYPRGQAAPPHGAQKDLEVDLL